MPTSESVYPAECGSYVLHGKHSWREGIFLQHKKVCLGTVQPPFDNGEDWSRTVNQKRADLGMSKIEPHKHFLLFDRVKSRGPYLMHWFCKTCRQQGLNHEVDLPRDIFRYNFLGGSDLYKIEQTWPG